MSKKIKSWPHWCDDYKSLRHFRQVKRRQARAAMKALDALRLGCAYTPTQGLIPQASVIIEEVIERMSQKEWGK